MWPIANLTMILKLSQLGSTNGRSFDLPYLYLEYVNTLLLSTSNQPNNSTQIRYCAKQVYHDSQNIKDTHY